MLMIILLSAAFGYAVHVAIAAFQPTKAVLKAAAVAATVLAAAFLLFLRSMLTPENAAGVAACSLFTGAAYMLSIWIITNAKVR